MNRERWQKVKSLFDAVVELHTPEREKLLAESCGADVELRRDVENLLTSSDNAESFMEQPAAEEVANLIIETKNLEAGTSFGHYQIIKQIGAGGMGEVYLAEDTKLDRQIALKILPSEVADDKDRVRRFVQEAKSASALNHPNILTVYEIGDFKNSRYIAAELIKGKTLRERLRDDSLTLRETLDAALQIAAALNAAHSAGIVHRDIKPENVMERDDGLVKVLDFGLAKLTERKTKVVNGEGETQEQLKTLPGMVMGTAAYMSPEQARGKEVDERSDIWSLGVLIYEMLARKTPFAGETTNDTIAAILEKEPAPLNGNMPPKLPRIIKKALQKKADERYQTVAEIQFDLKNLKREIEYADKPERPNLPVFAQIGANQGSGSATAIYPAAVSSQNSVSSQTSSAEYIVSEIKNHKRGFVVFSGLVFAAVIFGGWFLLNRSANKTNIESIAVMPFVNESGNADVEYLSDGMTETLIGSLSQLPKLNVKARSSVFRYKGKNTDALTIGRELNVQAILNGRVVERGQDLTLYIELVDAATENVLWKQTYNKTMSNLVALQNDIARDVADKLKITLSGADEQNLTKNYTENAEAYQLYLRGRFHVLKLKPSESQIAIDYYHQAIAIDPNYALAYAGLANAYQSLAVSGEGAPNEFFPKAKAAANRAIEIDDRLAYAHAVLGHIIYWNDWDWNAVENQCKRALELDPNNPEAHQSYAHLLSTTGRHTEALAEIKRARELDPLNSRIGVIEAQFLIYAGQPDEALAKLQKIFEFDPDFWFAHAFAASAYIEKKMYAEAVAEARKAKELSGGNTHAISYLGYALAKSGSQPEARAELETLIKLSAARFIPPYNIAMIYNGLGERDKTFEWLERGIEERDSKMVFLKVEPKWNDLRGDSRFQDLLRRVRLEK